MLRKKLAHQGNIGPSGKPEAFGAIGDAELGAKGLGKGLDARPAGMQERSIDIKEDQPCHRVKRWKKWSGRWDQCQ
jgi:hypothetical protein